MVNDPVSDLIIRLKNAGAVGRTVVSIPYSKLKHSIALKLKEHGYVSDVARRGKKARKVLDVELLYRGNEPRIREVVRVSKPGRRTYIAVSNIRPVRFGKGALFLTTPKGILTGEEARREHVGGEALFKIW